jgi:D-alanyl-D-alanine carboxypeptidase
MTLSPYRFPVALACNLKTAFVAAILAVVVPAGAWALTPYVLVEAGSGKVLMAENATMPWQPASVTKLMTAYVAMHAVRDGRISFDTAIPISMRAASQKPSKVGARPGTEVTLDNALKMMLVKSANDMAVVVAEGVGGSVENFAEMMNQEAVRLGMHESRFVNPNGLPAVGQQTSARDMAILANSILRDFPDWDGYFAIGAVQLGDRVMQNTNGLVGRYPGVIGMKTGFICASGFNLVAAAERNGRRLIAVVMGASSGADRVIKAADLLDKGFASSFFFSSQGTLDGLAPSGITTPPDVRDEVCGRNRPAVASEEEGENGAGVNSGVAVANFFGSQTSNGVRGERPGRLAPRGPLETLPVFLGRAPGSDTAPVAANAGSTPVKTATAYAGEGEPDAGALPIKLKPGAPSKGLKAKGKVAAKPSAVSAKTAGKASEKAAASAKKPADKKVTAKKPVKPVAGKTKPTAAATPSIMAE